MHRDRKDWNPSTTIFYCSTHIYRQHRYLPSYVQLGFKLWSTMPPNYVQVASSSSSSSLSVVKESNSVLGRFIVKVSRSHTIENTYTRWDACGRVISSTQRPLPTRHTTNTRDEHPCPHGDSNRRSQGWSGGRPTFKTA